MAEPAVIERETHATALAAAGLVLGSAVPGVAWPVEVVIALVVGVALAVAGMALLCRNRQVPFAAGLWAAAVTTTAVITLVEAARID